jgi:NADH-quinone oxidoreductase subunit F
MNRKELISKSDFIISLGSMLADNREEVTNSIIESIAKTNAKFTYMHPIDNINMKLYYSHLLNMKLEVKRVFVLYY